MEGLCPCGCLFIFIVIPSIISIISHVNRESEKAAWRQLAATHHLDFVSGNSFFGNGSYVTGFYRGHSLWLTTIEEKGGNSSITYTRAGVFAGPQPDKLPAKGGSKKPLTFQEAIDRFSLPDLPYSSEREFKVKPDGQAIYYEQPGIIQDTKFLEQLFDLLTNLVEAYPVIVAQGGEAILALQPAFEYTALKPVLLSVLRDIAHNTSMQLADRTANLLCPHCLTRFGSHKVSLSWWSNLTFYGCRRCSQSRSFYEGPVVAVLDSQMADKPVQQDGVIRVNWSTQRQLFDFDAVEIVRAGDEEVERFAVQVGNDTDETRESRYEEMQCVVLPGCQLSANTLRILRHTFGQVIS